MSRPLDLLILGGGCAGLSLARRLASLGERCPAVEVIERRSHYVNDRSWCFWARPTDTATQRWRSFRVHWGSASVECHCGATPYQLLQSDQFYEAALGEIAANASVTLTLATDILGDVTRDGDVHRVQTSGGMRRARWVIDTRPAGDPAEGGAVLWQSFLGWEIETEAPLFERAVADLMDFGSGPLASPDSIGFVYVLPLTDRRALIEPTVFSRMPQSPAQLNAMMLAALAGRLDDTAYTVLRREAGVLPMGLAPRAAARTAVPEHTAFSGSGHLSAGLGAGAARASTGYAFLRIQRWADACAARIAKGLAPCAQPPDRWVQRGMDHLFLSVLRNQPQWGPRIFFTLFTAVRTDRVIRFLSDRAHMWDLFCIVVALPAAPFLRELWRRPRPGRALPEPGAAP
jgi:lycopene beta-cyclase